MPGPTSSRAAQVLDALVREQQRRPLFRRGMSLADDRLDDPLLDDSHPGRDEGRPSSPAPEPTGGRWDEAIRPARAARPPMPTLRVLVVVAVLLAITTAVIGRQYLTRPAALDDRLPIASEEAPGTGGDGGDPSGSTSTGAGASSAVPGGADPLAGSGGAAAGATVPGAGPVFVHVAGSVASPGVVQLPGGSRVVDAVSAAGGLRADADADRVNLAAPLVDGSRVVVPALGQAPPLEVVTVPPVTGAGGTGVGGPTHGPGGSAASSAPVDLNTATLEQLDELPGVGPSTAQAIIDHRLAEGPFDSVDALLDVRGIGDAKLEAIRDLVIVG